MSVSFSCASGLDCVSWDKTIVNPWGYTGVCLPKALECKSELPPDMPPPLKRDYSGVDATMSKREKLEEQLIALLDKIE